MAANNALKITSIDFDTIKSNLRDFLSSQSELQDYDYDSSTIQTVLDILAYNTYYNSFYLNMVANEMFLDSAQIRKNVVSRAKQIGYTPRSARGATASLSVTITPGDAPESINIPAGTVFNSTIDGITYDFTTLSAYSITPASGVYNVTVEATEGNRVQESYTVNSNSPSRYILNNTNGDTSTLAVTVQESASNTSITTYTLASDFSDVTATSEVYFLNEYEDEKFEVYFGDNVIGKKPRDGNIVKLNYNVVNGGVTNNANTFVAASSISGYSDIDVATVSRASGGSDIETSGSIKLNAPNAYISQNRAVTALDYKTLIQNNFGSLQTVSIWGGEENTPPQYGRVYIAAKPTNGLILSQTLKENIVSYLQTKKILTIEPIVVDATYLFVEPTIDARFNPDNTNKDSTTIASEIQTALLNYETNQLGLFGQQYINSEVIKLVDAVNDAITSVSINLKLVRRFIPELNQSETYTIPFNHSLLDVTGGVVLPIRPTAHPGQGVTLTSTSFTFNGFTCQMDDDGFGNVRFFRRTATGIKIYENRAAGTIDYTTGLMRLNNVNITAYQGNYIEIFVVPTDDDIVPVRNQLILFSGATIRVYDNNLQRVTASVINVETAGDAAELQEYGTAYSIF